jgi:glycine dehydrogenase subunit 2
MSLSTVELKVITLMPDDNGYPDLEAMKAALSDRTAAIFITNPEDTGIYNPRIKEYTDAARQAGALCVYDQANANALLGIARAKEAGFDLCHFILHKTFSAPHGCMGPGVGAIGVKEFLKPFLPVPRVEFDGSEYTLNYEYPQSIGRVRSFFGNAPIVLKAYMWIMQMGADGLKEASVISVLNNQYMCKHIAQIPGVVIHYAEGKRRMEQVRYSWEKLKADTGFGTEDVQRRMVDFGLQHYWMSHHPWIIPEPFTLEPCEAYSKDDIDEYLAILRQISKECYENPEIIENAPHNAPIHKLLKTELDDYEDITVTWRQWKKKKLNK